MAVSSQPRRARKSYYICVLPLPSVLFNIQLSTVDLQIFLSPTPIPFPLNRFRTLFASAAHNGTRIPLLFFHLQTLCRHNRGALQRHTLQRNNMIEKTDNSNSVNQLSLCRHRTVSGRRCRLRVLNPESHLCFRHAQLRQKKRRAGVMAYTCNLLLRTLPAIGYENELQAGPPRLEAGTIPRPGQRRPDRDDGPTVIWDVPGVNSEREKTPSCPRIRSVEE